MSLQHAPAHVVLAVDLIELLESNQIDAKIVLAALPLITRDYQRKLTLEQTSHRETPSSAGSSQQQT